MIRILHVEDDESDHQLVELNLIRLTNDLKFNWANSGNKALKLLQEKEYDCILSDYQMPGLDGLEFLKIVREKKIDLPFIFLTGQGNEQIAAEALRAGADDYFSKEIGIAHYERLINSIKRHFEAKAHRDERMSAEKALKESEQRYRTLFEAAGDAIFFFF